MSSPIRSLGKWWAPIPPEQKVASAIFTLLLVVVASWLVSRGCRAMVDRMTLGGDWGSPMLLLGLVLALYFAPALVANGRGHHNSGAIGALNLFLGWTVIGWIVALIWALTNPPKPARTTTSAPPGSGFCPACGKPIPREGRYCPGCGAPAPAID